MAVPFNQIENVLNEHLLPRVTKIDQEGLYPGDMLRILGDLDVFALNKQRTDQLLHTIQLVENVGTMCSTTAFIIWCHSIAIQLVSQSDNEYLKHNILPDLTTGILIGSTGLSNAMKSFAGIESVLLKGYQSNDGIVVSGELPFVSNLGPVHWFAVIIEVEMNKQMIAFLPCKIPGLTLSEQKNLLGMNGTATYSCHFQDVFIPWDWILTKNASQFLNNVREEFVLKQVAIPLGLIQASLQSIESFRNKRAINQYLPFDIGVYTEKYNSVKTQTNSLANKELGFGEKMKEIFRVRLESTYLAMEIANAEMLYAGASGYIKGSHPSRRLKEAIFFGLITPSVKHLEKVLK